MEGWVGVLTVSGPPRPEESTSTVAGSTLTMYAAPDDFGEGDDTGLLTYTATVTPLR